MGATNTNTNTNIQGGSISTDPNAMTIGEYVLENIRRLKEAGNDTNKSERERAIRRAQAVELQNFYNTQIKDVKSSTGGKLGDMYANRMPNTFKDMFQKSAGIKFGELQGQENQTQMELPEAVKQAMQSFVGPMAQDKAANPVTKDCVHEDPESGFLTVDTKHLSLTEMSLITMLAKRVEAIEEKLKEKK